ncbi:MAG: DinB family protein [Acidobacteriaceae bacterium]
MAIPAALGLGAVLRKELKALLDGGQAHAKFDDAVKDFPAKLRGVAPEGLPYSAWQILEHIRIAQRDILDFSRNTDGNYKEQRWPDAYWPDAAEPPSEDAWEQSIAQVRKDRKAFESLLASTDDTNLIVPFKWGEGQTLLREALLIADHDAYHVGELVVLRRLLGAWKK